MKRHCETCKYWEDFNTATNQDTPIGGPPIGGLCRRHSPCIISHFDPEVPPNIFGEWPGTSKADWCGEWEEDDNAQ
jgi:hypothetical protein